MDPALNIFDCAAKPTDSIDVLGAEQEVLEPAFRRVSDALLALISSIAVVEQRGVGGKILADVMNQGRRFLQADKVVVIIRSIKI